MYLPKQEREKRKAIEAASQNINPIVAAQLLDEIKILKENLYLFCHKQ